MNTSLTLARISELTNSPLQDVQTLALVEQHIETLPDLSPCVSLSKLDLSRNKLTNDGLDGLADCPSLSVLNVAENQLETFAPLDKLKASLSVVNVSGNAMYHLSSHLLSLTNLKALIAKNMQIAKIENLGHCKELNTLILANNKITSISNLKSLVHLKKLSLAQNPIRVLPDLSCHTELKELRLNGCLLESLPESIRKLSILEILDIGNNRIHQVQSMKSLEYLTQLSQLNVKGNPFCASEPDYEASLRKWVPGLSVLDGQRLSRSSSKRKRPPSSGTPFPKRQAFFATSQRKSKGDIKQTTLPSHEADNKPTTSMDYKAQKKGPRDNEFSTASHSNLKAKRNSFKKGSKRQIDPADR